MVCNSAGTCIACKEGDACTTNPGKACKLGVVSCSTGAVTCLDGANKTDGTLCGAGPSCAADTLTPAQMCDTGACTTGPTSHCDNGCNATNDGCADPPPPPPTTFAAPKKRAQPR